MVGVHGDDRAENILVQQPPYLPDVRQKARPHRLHEEELLGARGRHELPGLACIDRKRLLDHDRLPHSSASIAPAWCIAWGVATYTTSTSESATSVS